MTFDDEPMKIPRDELGDQIRTVPYAPPASGLTARIMAGLSPRRLPWWRRLYRRTLTPVTLRITPLYAMAVAVMLLASGGLVLHQMAGMGPAPLPPSQDHGGIPVVLEFNDPGARTVSVMGSFNRWDPGAGRMEQDPRTGRWRIVLHLPPGSHEYVFWIDGREPAIDPNADLVRQDDFGNRNSVLFVKGDHGQAT